MKIITKYTISSILKTALITIWVFVSIMIIVELFVKIDSIINNQVPIAKLLYNIVLGLPKFLMMGISISFLFSTTFFLSQLQANNEIIALFNSGFSYKKIINPVILLVFILTILLTLFNETFGIKINNLYSQSEQELFGRSSTTNMNISVKDPDTNLLCYANSFSEVNQTLYNISLIFPVEKRLGKKIVAQRATYENDEWLFYDVKEYEINENNVVKVTNFPNKLIPEFTFQPKIFKNLSGEISSMEIGSAIEYLRRTKVVNPIAYSEYSTTLYQRLFSALPLFILVLISCSINYNYKKNILLFSILQSLCTAVVYYVSVMLVTIMGNQGMILAPLTVILPVLLVYMIAMLFKLIGCKR